MGQIYHGNAKTTAAVRREIQNSQESLMTLSKRYGINIKTVAKWKKRNEGEDLPAGPKNPRSTVRPRENSIYSSPSIEPPSLPSRNFIPKQAK